MTLIYFNHALPDLDQLRPDYNCFGMLFNFLSRLNAPYNDFDIYFNHALPDLDRLRPDYNCFDMLSNFFYPT